MAKKIQQGQPPQSWNPITIALPLPPLLSLPNEILLNVIENYLRYQDLENFSISCRRIYNIATTHRHLKKVYNTVAVAALTSHDRNDDNLSPPHPEFFIRAALHDPRISEYVRHVVVGESLHGYATPVGSGSGVPRLLKLLKLQVMNAFRHLDLSTIGIRCIEHRINQLRAIHFPAPFEGMLLALLPRIEHLEVTDSQIRPLGLLLRIYLARSGIALQSHRPPDLLTAIRRALENIKEITLHGISDSKLVDIEHLFNYAALPNVHTIRGYHFVSQEPDPFPRRMPEARSNFQHLYLLSSRLSTYHVVRLLKLAQPDTLKSFTYSCSVGNGLYHLSIDWPLLMNTLRSHASGSLVQLDLEIADEEESERSTPFFRSFAAFLRLRRLRIECSMLIMPDLDNPRVGKPLIISRLPPSLEVLEVLRRNKTEEEMQQFIAKLGEQTLNLKTFDYLGKNNSQENISENSVDESTTST